MDPVNALTLDSSASCKWTLSDLIHLCRSEPVCAKLLHFLYARPTTLMTCSDISFYLGISIEDVDSAIDKLADMGLLRRLSFEGSAFCGLTDEERALGIVTQFETWCASARQRWQSEYGVIL